MPDVTSVRSLVTSVTELANHLGLTNNAIYRMIKLNRIPGKHLIKVAAFYDIDIPIHLAQSDEKSKVSARRKPKDTLPVCLRVQHGELTIDEAARMLGLHERAVQLILKNWGDDLPVLYRTMLDLEDQAVSLDEAAKRLNVSKYNVHALRKKYGFAPGVRRGTKERPIVKRRQTARMVALDAIAGRIKLKETEDASGQSWRTIHRMIKKLSPDYTVIDLAHWPKSFRAAYAEEIDKNLPKMVEKWWKYAEITGISLKKLPKYPQIPKNFRITSVKKMLIHVLLGDVTLQEVADLRGADPHILATLFTSDLRPLDLTWDQVSHMPLSAQMALAELLLAIEDASKTPRMKLIERIAEKKHD